MPPAFKFASGQSIMVRAEAGPRLGGKRGIVLGAGATSTRVRIRLHGSKGPITLHKRFLSPLSDQGWAPPPVQPSEFFLP